MKTIVEESKKIIQALGDTRRIVSKAEEEKKKNFRRSIVIKKDLRKGDILRETDILFKRPGVGIRPDEYKYVIDRVLKRNLSSDELLHWDDLL